MTKLTPDQPCSVCGGLLVPPSLAPSFKVPEETDYVCMKCGRQYQWSGNPPKLVLMP